MKLLETVNDIIIGEAIKELSLIRKYEEYIKKPYVVEQVNEIIEKLKTLDNFIGTNRNGKRLYFTTDYENEELSTDDTTLYNRVKSQLDRYSFDINLDLYKEGYTIDASGRKVKIGKVLNMIINKSDGDEYYKELVKSLLQDYNQDPVRLQGQMTKKKKLIVMSTANYDIAGMTQGRSWQRDSCMRLDNGYGQGSTYVHCDIMFGTIVVYLINASDKNIENPLGRTLVKPYIDINIGGDGRKVYYATDPKEYGGQTGFNSLVDKIFKEIQSDKSGEFKLHHRLSNQGRGRLSVRRSQKIIDQEFINDEIRNSRSENFISINPEYSEGEVYEKVEEFRDVKLENRHTLMLSSLDKLSIIDNFETDGYTSISNCVNLSQVTNITTSGTFRLVNCNKLKKISGTFSNSFYLESILINSSLDLTELNSGWIFGVTFEDCNVVSLPQLNNNVEDINFRNCKMMSELPSIIGGGHTRIYFRDIKEEDLPKIPENRNYKVSIS